jgi:exosortase E/protease (VPEID-CTERM system)
MSRLVFPRHFLGRLYLLGLLAVVECVACFPNENMLFGHQRYLRIAVVACAVFFSLGYAKFKTITENISFSRIFFAGHLICIGAVFVSSLLRLLYGNDWIHFEAVDYGRSVPGFAWSAVYLLGTLLLAQSLIPIRAWTGAIRLTSPAWIYACVAGVGAWSFGFPFRKLFDASVDGPSSGIQIFTFNTVATVMRHLLPDYFADLATVTMGTPRYEIVIVGGCSGIEGLGLVLAFSLAWLWYFRKELRFFRALLLIVCALVCSWLLNIARLCTLILVGNSGRPEIADVGLHSQFGWIAFTVIALAFTMATQRLGWVRKAPVEAVSGVAEAAGEVQGESPAIRAYLLPFLAILAATFVSKAASGYFEWLYPLRFFAAAAALWFFRTELKKLDWRIGWLGVATGVAIFLVWMTPSWRAGHFAASPIGPALGALSPAARWFWIAARVAAACVTVPMAEELAFRGYLARRLMDREFDQVRFTSLTAWAMVLSSAAFGLMHGQHWAVGFVAGLAYASVLRWRGRMGDAVVAHAVSNLLLAAWVLGTGDWGQW